MLMPIMINGDTIGAVYARRLEPQSQGRKTYTYEWEVTCPPLVHAQGTGLRHVRSEGAVVLLMRILQAAGIEATQL
jgi:hypothetical protein